jgi:hypothetical protein
MSNVLATAQDVADIWRPLTDAETVQADNLCAKASARLRQKCPFDVDARIALFSSNPADPTALDPLVVTDVVAGIVKRAMVNPDGATSVSTTRGPFSDTKGFGGQRNQPANTLVVLDSDIDQLRPAKAATVASTLRVGPASVPDPAFTHGRTYLPRWRS